MIPVRAAQSGDRPAIARILHDWIAATPWMPKLHSWEETLWFASHLHETTELSVAGDDTVAGFLSLQEAEIPALYVAGSARGRGVGSALLQKAQSMRPALSLWTFEQNAPARRFYAQHGFLEVARTDGAGNDEKLPDIRLEWRRP